MHLRFLLLLGAAACGGVATQPSDGGSSASTDAISSADGGAAKEGDRTTVGVYSCCAKGESTACCANAKQGTCFEYGGLYHDCRAQGEDVEAKVICAHCCAGLERVAPQARNDAGACEETAPPSLFVCVACGDGVCGPGENGCVCPADCN